MNDAGYTSTASGLRAVPLELTGDYATGTRGLAQRFMTLMLSSPETGVRTIGGGLIKSTLSSTEGNEAIKNAVNIAISNVVGLMRKSEKSSDPREERMGSAVLSKIELLGRDGIALEFSVTSLAKTTATATTTI